MSNTSSGRDTLAEQYADASNLDARIALHERYSTAEEPFRDWQFDQFDHPSSARVLVLGCGPGDLWVETCDRVPATWDVTLTDFSRGMLEEARANLSDCPRTFDYEVVDAETIPFSDGSFDAVTANHMLYHVRDRSTALAEIRRVLAPGGRLYATTNGAANMRSLLTVMDEVLDEYTADGTDFTLENGREQLSPYFDQVTLRRRDDALVVPGVGPLVAYALSSRYADESLAPAFREAFASRFEDGVFRVEKDVGMFIAQKRRQ